MQLIWCLLSNFYLNMFRASLCPSSGACVPAPHKHSHHYQCRTPYAAVHTLVLLMMGIMMPKTSWDKSLKINIRLVASCWSLSSPYVHDARSQGPKFFFLLYLPIAVKDCIFDWQCFNDDLYWSLWKLLVEYCYMAPCEISWLFQNV